MSEEETTAQAAATPQEVQAQNAYEALSQLVFGVSTISGKTLPPWTELPSTVTDTWVAAVQAVEDYITAPPPPPEEP